MTARRRIGATCLLVSMASLAGCQAQSFGDIGPAPLRRMSNSEYLNTLQDLFPTVHPTLPTLPADAVVAGFENAAESQAPTDVRIARYEAIANLYAAASTTTPADVATLAGCSDWSTPDLANACATQFITQVARRLYRRPITDAERDRLLLRFHAWQIAIDFEAAARLTLSAMLQSPQFLYRVEMEPLDSAPGSVTAVEPYALASRLSFLLWESAPDESLLTAAAHDELHTPEQIRAQATRMLADPRTRRIWWDFHRQWLGLDRILNDEHTVRTPDVDPGWSATSPLSAWTESRLFIENTMFTTGSFRDLLLSPEGWLDGEMARQYGVTPPADPTQFTEVTLPTDQRAGLLTRTAFLAAYSHRGGTSPPVRGNAILLRVLCELPVSPPAGVDLSQPVPDPALGPQTNRQLFEARTAPAACQGCHSSLNGYGFGLENYSAAGAFQTVERGLAIDASGHFSRTDVDRVFAGGIDLSRGLSQSRTVGRCLTQQWLRYALGRAPLQSEQPFVESLTDRFMASGGNERSLLLDIVASPTFLYRTVEAR